MDAAAPPVCRLVQDPAEWPALRAHWQRLHAATPQATPWQSYEFLHEWWLAMAGDRRLCLVVVMSGGEPCLILPLQISRTQMLGLRLRLLEPLGMPDDINRPRMAIGPPDAPALHCALEAIWSMRAQWDAIRLDEHENDDPELVALREFAGKQGLRYREAPLHPCPYLDLRRSWPEFLESRGDRLRRNLRAAQRKLVARGAVRLAAHSSPAEFPAAFDRLMDIHLRSWKHMERVGLCQSAQYREFYRRFALDMAARGAARILLLYCGDVAVAGTIAFTDAGVYYSAQIAHDDSYSAASPGTLLESMELERLLGEGGFREFDFLGAALNNKLRWTDTVRETSRVLLFRKGWRNLLIDTYYFTVKPRLKALSRPRPR